MPSIFDKKPLNYLDQYNKDSLLGAGIGQQPMQQQPMQQNGSIFSSIGNAWDKAIGDKTFFTQQEAGPNGEILNTHGEGMQAGQLGLGLWDMYSKNKIQNQINEDNKQKLLLQNINLANSANASNQNHDEAIRKGLLQRMSPEEADAYLASRKYKDENNMIGSIDEYKRRKNEGKLNV